MRIPRAGPRARLLASAGLTALITATGATDPVAREGVHNGGFELGVSRDGTRPGHWYVGFPGDAAPPPGRWSLATRSEGGMALELVATSEDAIFVSQVVDLPAGTMAGVTVTLSASVAVVDGHGWAVVQLIALNPEVDPDPETGIPEVGYLALGSQEQPWTGLHDQVQLAGEAELLAVILVATGAGTVARFDDVSVSATLEPPGTGPDPRQIPLPATGKPSFSFGVTNESPRNQSDQAISDLARDALRVADLVNLFLHVRWNGLAGRPALDGHGRVLEQARNLRRFGMSRMMTFDFTHDSLAGLGDLNPLPDGTPVGSLDDPSVRQAYLDELLALVLAIEPTIVSVGIETDFFWQKHPDQWPAFRDMLCSARDRIEAVDPEIHVTTYFTLPTLVGPDGALRQEGAAAMRELLPCIGSVGYSYYPADGTAHLSDIPAGMFTAAAEVAPGLPLIVPEFGFRSDGVYSEQEQEEFLRRALEELADHDVCAVVWYSLHDQTYLGVALWFQEAFRSIGLRRADGTPKRSHALLERIHTSGRRRGGGRRLAPFSLPASGS